MEREIITHITKDFKNSYGGGEGCKVYTITSLSDGQTEVVIETTQTARYPVQQLNEVLKLADNITGGGGRRVVSVDDIAAIALHRSKLTPKSLTFIKPLPTN